MIEVSIRLLSEDEITFSLFQRFNRRQEVTKCLRREKGNWVLKNDCFVDDWNESQYHFLVECLKNTVKTKGIVLGAFVRDRLIGFASVESRHFGSRGQYVQLSCIHVSSECRGLGLGGKLFQYACMAAGRLGAQKLYISSHPAYETQLFYRGRGCTDAKEYDEEIAVVDEPQLEYVLAEYGRKQNHVS